VVERPVAWAARCPVHGGAWAGHGAVSSQGCKPEEASAHLPDAWGKGSKLTGEAGEGRPRKHRAGRRCKAAAACGEAEQPCVSSGQEKVVQTVKGMNHG